MKTGFVSMSTFNRNFTRFLGTSPHVWRKSKGRTQHPLLKILLEKYGKKPAFFDISLGKKLSCKKQEGFLLCINI